MNSLSFNSVNLSTYGLIVNQSGVNSETLKTQSLQLKDKSYGANSDREPKIIEPLVSIHGSSKEDIKDKIDAVKRILDELTDKELVFDRLPDRYFLAKKVRFDPGSFRGPYVWEGRIRFECNDPFGYGVTEVASVHAIGADPTTVTETTVGSADIWPVYLITATAALGAVIVLLDNLNTDEQLRWTGSLANTNELEINTVTWHVTKEGVASMATVTGQFPILKPSVANSIRVTGVSSATLTITYRDRFL